MNPRLIELLAQFGVPDRISFFGGIRRRVAQIFIDAVKKYGKTRVKLMLAEIVELASKELAKL